MMEAHVLEFNWVLAISLTVDSTGHRAVWLRRASWAPNIPRAMAPEHPTTTGHIVSIYAYSVLAIHFSSPTVNHNFHTTSIYMARQHNTSLSASQPLTSAEKSKATKLAHREAQRLQDEADASAASRLRKYTFVFTTLPY